MKKLITIILTLFAIHAFADEYTDTQTEAVSAGVSVSVAESLAQKTKAAGYSTQNMIQIRNMIRTAQKTESVKMAEKTLEGIAKKVPEAKVMQALNMIQNRYAYAKELAEKTKVSAKYKEAFADAVADAMAAGAQKKGLDAMGESVAQSKQERNEYAMAVTAMYRDMMRYGVKDETASEVAVMAMKKLNVKQINEYRQNFMQNAGGNAGAYAKSMGANMSKGLGASSMGSGGGSGAGGSSGGAGGSGGSGGGHGGGGHGR